MAVLAAGGCSFETSLRYAPTGGDFGPPQASVAVRVVNNRPPGHGGQTDSVGRVRGGYGNPFPIHERDPANIQRTVLDATTDALRHAGVAVVETSDLVVVASIDEYWIDGYMAFNAHVRVAYTLQDSQGAELWAETVAAGGGATMRFSVFEADSIAQESFAKALEGANTQAIEAFRREEFQQFLRPAPGAATAARAG
jgi:hypothetical protein